MTPDDIYALITPSMTSADIANTVIRLFQRHEAHRIPIQNRMVALRSLVRRMSRTLGHDQVGLAKLFEDCEARYMVLCALD